MNLSKPKSKPTALAKFQRQYNLRLSLEDCRRLLEKRVEHMESWRTILRYGGRVSIDTWDVEDGLVKFRAYRTESHWLSIALPATSAEGTLHRQADGTTTLLVEATTTRIGRLIFWQLRILFVLGMTVFFSERLGLQGWLLLWASFVLFAIIVWFSWDELGRRQDKLLAIVDDAIHPHRPATYRKSRHTGQRHMRKTPRSSDSRRSL
jgi:hypothetical protein